MIKFLKRIIGRLSRSVRAAWPRPFSTRPNAPATSSAELLLRRIARHADSQFGKDHFFAEIRSPADFALVYQSADTMATSPTSIASAKVT